MWIAHDMRPQKLLGYFIVEIHHKTLPDMFQVRVFAFKDTKSPKMSLSYAASNRLGIIELKIPNGTPSTALDAINTCQETHHIQHSTPKPHS